MTDTRLRELERRWKETGASEDWAAYLREQARTGTGVVREAEAFLEEARELAAGIETPHWRALALAHVAHALAELGVGDRAAAVADEAERCLQEPAPNRGTVPPRTLARIGGVRERALGHGAGEVAFAQALELLCRELPDRTAQRAHEMTPEHGVAQRALTSLIGELASATPDGTHSSILAELSAALEALPTNALVSVAAPVWEPLLRLGLGAYVRDRALKLLETERLEHLRSEVVSGRASPASEELFAVTVAVELVLRIGRAPDLVERCRSVLRVMSGLPDTWVTSCHAALQQVLSRSDDPFAVTVADRVHLSARWAAAFEVAALRAVAARSDASPELRARAVTQLEQRFEAFGDGPGFLLGWSVEAAGELLSGAAGVERVRSALSVVEADGLGARGQDVFLSAVSALSRLGGQAAGELLDTLIGETLGACEREPDGLRVLYARLDACVEAARRLRLPALLDPVRQAARAGVRRTAGLDGQGAYLMTLLQVAFAALALGDERAFERDGAIGFGALPRLRLLDRMSVHAELAKLVAGAPLDLRHALARQLLKSAAAWEPAPGGDGVLVGMFEDLCAAAVRFDA